MLNDNFKRAVVRFVKETEGSEAICIKEQELIVATLVSDKYKFSCESEFFGHHRVIYITPILPENSNVYNHTFNNDILKSSHLTNNPFSDINIPDSYTNEISVEILNRQISNECSEEEVFNIIRDMFMNAMLKNDSNSYK